MNDVKIIVSAEVAPNVQSRIHEVMHDLGFSSYASAEEAAGLCASQIHQAVHRCAPGLKLIQRIADGWGVRPLVFFLTRQEAQPYIASVLKTRLPQKSREVTKNN